MRKHKKFGRTVSLMVLGLFLLGSAFSSGKVWGIDNNSEDDLSGVLVPPGYKVEFFADTGPIPTGLDFDSNGNLFVAKSGGTWDILPIVKITPDGTVTDFGASIEDADGIAVDSSDNVFVADGHRITKITQDGTTTIFLSGFDNLNDISIDKLDNMFVGENNGQVFKVTSDGSFMAVAGGFDFGLVSGVVVDDHNLFISDCEGDQIFKVDLDTDTITVITTEVISPQRGAFGPSGELFVTDAYLGEILKISPDGTITGFANGLANPYGLAFSESGDLFVTDSGNNRILKISKARPEMPDDTMAPTGAVHAYDNMLWPPNNKLVTVTLDGYVIDELSIARDEAYETGLGGGIGVASAYLLVDDTEIILRDDSIDLLGEDGSFSVEVEIKAIKGAVYTVELYATDTEPEEGWETSGPNSGLVDSTYIRVPHDMSRGKSGK